jgi:Mrp family chromosome partitioning ATPase/uncharacterized protein involved in exopolysaccharide biosynthesis
VLIFVVGTLTFCFRPIYSVTTIVTWDADLSKVLRNISASYPSSTHSDFIRNEYFATHAVSLMRVPQLAGQLVEKWNIRDSWGEKLFPGYLIEPSFFQLFFSNNGQGIKVRWLSDTQQFGISGYSKDPNRAVDYSRDYTEAFLKENSEQFRDILIKLEERTDIQRKSANIRIEILNLKMQEILNQNKTGDLETEIKGLTSKILVIKKTLEDSQITEKVYQQRRDFLSQEAKKYEELIEYEKIMETNPQIKTLKDEIQSLTGALISASIDYTREHPTYKAIEKKLDNAKESFKKEIQTTLYHQTKRRSSQFEVLLGSLSDADLAHLEYQIKIECYKSIMEQLNERLDNLVAAQLKINNLNSELRNLSTALSNVEEIRQTVEGVLNRPLPFFRVVSDARIYKENLKYYKYFPKRKLILTLSLIASLFAFSFLVIARELYDNTLYLGWQLSALKSHIDYVDVPDMADLTKNQRGLEALICKHIHEICLATKDSQLIRLSSGIKGEGKATIARALAWYFQKTGKSVLLVDADIAYHSLSHAFDLDDRPGLTEYLYALKEISDIIVKDHDSGIAIIPIGSQPVLDLDPLLPTRLETLISRLSSDYEKIIFLDVPSNENIHMLADNLPAHDVITVFRSGKHSIYEVEHMAKLQEMTGAQGILKGIVINRTPFMADIFKQGGYLRLVTYLVIEPFRRLRREAPK